MAKELKDLPEDLKKRLRREARSKTSRILEPRQDFLSQRLAEVAGEEYVVEIDRKVRDNKTTVCIGIDEEKYPGMVTRLTGTPTDSADDFFTQVKDEFEAKDFTLEEQKCTGSNKSKD